MAKKASKEKASAANGANLGFWVPPEARWAYLKSMAPQPTIAQRTAGIS